MRLCYCSHLVSKQINLHTHQMIPETERKNIEEVLWQSVQVLVCSELWKHLRSLRGLSSGLLSEYQVRHRRTEQWTVQVSSIRTLHTRKWSLFPIFSVNP